MVQLCLIAWLIGRTPSIKNSFCFCRFSRFLRSVSIYWKSLFSEKILTTFGFIYDESPYITTREDFLLVAAEMPGVVHYDFWACGRGYACHLPRNIPLQSCQTGGIVPPTLPVHKESLHQAHQTATRDCH